MLGGQCVSPKTSQVFDLVLGTSPVKLFDWSAELTERPPPLRQLAPWAQSGRYS
jgi:hypothetical protein